jgi:Kef-type K+ transport system membrane component KefB
LIVAFAMNARGAMGIVLTSLALEYKVISERVFVALIVQAVVTSLMSGVVIRRLLPLKEPACAAVTAA